MTWSALVLAGSRGATDPVARAAGVSHKAFAPLAGRPMLAHVLDALAAAPEVGRVAVSIEPEAPPIPAEGIERLAAEGSPARSALAAFDRLGPPLLIVTADHPLLSPAMIRDALAQVGEADVAAALSPRAAVEAAGSPAARTWLRFRDGDFSGCNIFACRTPEARRAIELWTRLEADRKRPWRMVRRLGLRPLAAYLAGRLALDGAVAALGVAAGCRAAAARLDQPEAAHDVDKPEDLAFVRRLLAARQAAGSPQAGSGADARDQVSVRPSTGNPR
ncbi:NTP transferase domain-containing protein [Albimonas pacifica]|uniref:GTP:adenosylcobinamide-phosphate guanylyltransferase n=1 Tax=Albimonas pacifica TaxID=1114924 RepID=A0A1I3BQ39_9RHOB|nr:NTP transferase domain-containing protein [Albimonas pacifica]SFH64392.1 GTP:adenosylcobinamide-phosphate guanylyltransferase [Albimonas pacifica]